MNEVVVVGASLAGLRAVETLRRRGYDGRIAWVGAERGPPYDRPPLSKQILRGEWTPERAVLKSDPAALLEVDMLFGRRAEALDPKQKTVTLDGGELLSYDGLVVATGAAPRTLPGRMPRGVHTLRTLDDAIAIRDACQKKPRVAIVGAGFIGLEVAASCRRLGLEVTVLEAAPLPLSTLGPAMARAIADLHRGQGVRLRTGVTVDRLLGSGEVEGVALSDTTVVAADLVVVGIGVVPETAWLSGSGVVSDGGVVCDATGATSVPGIVAAGDVARWESPVFGESFRIEHWTSAVEQATAAVARLLDGPSAPPLATVPYFWSDQYDAKFQFAGRVAPTDALEIVEGSVAERNLVALYRRGGRLRGVLTMNKPGALAKYRSAILTPADG